MAGWTSLASSNLSACSYDEATKVLQIRFKSGRTYSYRDVPPDVAAGLETASSPGQYFNGAIKDVYSYG